MVVAIDGRPAASSFTGVLLLPSSLYKSRGRAPASPFSALVHASHLSTLACATAQRISGRRPLLAAEAPRWRPPHSFFPEHRTRSTAAVFKLRPPHRSPSASPRGRHRLRPRLVCVVRTPPAPLISCAPSRSTGTGMPGLAAPPLPWRRSPVARAASPSPCLSSPRSQLHVGRNHVENLAPELEIKRAPASSAAGPAGRRRAPLFPPPRIACGSPGSPDRQWTAQISSGCTPLASSRWTHGPWSTARSTAVSAARSVVDGPDRPNPPINKPSLQLSMRSNPAVESVIHC
jgi:hypothetical protein